MTKPRIIGGGYISRALTAAALTLVLALFTTCGIDTFVYLYPVEVFQNNPGTNAVTLRMPTQPPEFRYYIIYYRIYLSDSFGTYGITQLELINPILRNHYTNLERYTSDDTASSVSLDSIFRGYGYYSLFASGSGDLSNLSAFRNQSGGTAILNFAPLSTDPSYPYPLVIYSGTSEPLFRNNAASTVPDERYFFADVVNAPSTSANIDLERFRDSSNNPISTSYAYVSMYILAFGNDSNYSPVYSQPKHMGIFVLDNKPSTP